MRFWDTSALVSLLLAQAPSATAQQWVAEDGVLVLWTLTHVEIVSALSRLVRERALDERAARDIEDVAGELLGRAHVVTDIERVKNVACRLLRVHALRAADALQLGAALTWADGQPEGLVLHTFDRQLAVAADREGFRVVGA